MTKDQVLPSQACKTLAKSLYLSTIETSTKREIQMLK